MAQRLTTLIELPEITGSDRRADLELETFSPFGGGLVSVARVSHTKNGFRVHRAGSDFTTRVVQDCGARATAKNIREQHARAFNRQNIELLKSRALYFYAVKQRSA